MVKPEWGIKRHCQACGANFYDLRRSPIICPKCGDEFDPEAFVKPRRSQAPVEKEVAAPVKKDAIEAPAEKDEKTGDKLAAAESLDDNLVTASLDEDEEEKVFVPSEELEAEPDFQAEGEENGDVETKPDEAAEKPESEEKAKTGTKPAKAKKAKPAPKKEAKAKPAKAEPETTKPKKETKAKSAKNETKKKAEPKKKPPAKAKAAKGKKA